MGNRIMILVMLLIPLLFTCNKGEIEYINYKEEMRNFVIGISQYAKTQNSGFVIIPQNGQELITEDGEITSQLANDYIDAIDGQGREDLFYGYDADDMETNASDRTYIISYLDKIKQKAKTILVIDYCSTISKMNNSYALNNNNGFISFAADQRELTNIPNIPSPIYAENKDTIVQLSQAKNFLYLINPTNYTKSQFINAVRNTNYDVLIMDLFLNEVEFTAQELDSLKLKQNGGIRLIMCYMSIGEAENYRYYWQNSWNNNKSSWLGSENPDWEGNFKVKYWNKEWQNIIYGNEQSYLKKIINAHFDGVYLDIIDAFEYYEK
ncbi:MAG: endo alpha-1,4 polygalactosaminidase [Bacteroidota bacterium]|nr:endo alpha-1,4 polygalactosaminidase [Bacteroidota bacterium]